MALQHHHEPGHEIHAPTRAQTRHFDELRRHMPPDFSDDILMKCAVETENYPRYFADKSRFWSIMLDHVRAVQGEELKSHLTPYYYQMAARAILASGVTRKRIIGWAEQMAQGAGRTSHMLKFPEEMESLERLFDELRALNLKGESRTD